MTLSPTQCNLLTVPRGSWGATHSLKVTVTSNGPNNFTFIAERTEKDLLGPLAISGTFSRLNDHGSLQGDYKYKTASEDSDPEEGEFMASYDENKNEWRLHPQEFAYDETWTLSRKED